MQTLFTFNSIKILFYSHLEKHFLIIAIGIQKNKYIHLLYNNATCDFVDNSFVKKNNIQRNRLKLIMSRH